jgi:flagellar basal body-associated protein FliL
MRDPAGDRERMERQRRNRKSVWIFAGVVIVALLISALGATLRAFG